MYSQKGASCAGDEVARLRKVLADRVAYATIGSDPKRDTILRRIFAIEHDIAFTNPFDAVNETLYRIGGRQ